MLRSFVGRTNKLDSTVCCRVWCGQNSRTPICLLGKCIIRLFLFLTQRTKPMDVLIHKQHDALWLKMPIKIIFFLRHWWQGHHIASSLESWVIWRIFAHTCTALQADIRRDIVSMLKLGFYGSEIWALCKRLNDPVSWSPFQRAAGTNCTETFMYLHPNAPVYSYWARWREKSNDGVDDCRNVLPRFGFLIRDRRKQVCKGCASGGGEGEEKGGEGWRQCWQWTTRGLRPELHGVALLKSAAQKSVCYRNAWKEKWNTWLSLGFPVLSAHAFLQTKNWVEVIQSIDHRWSYIT